MSMFHGTTDPEPGPIAPEPRSENGDVAPGAATGPDRRSAPAPDPRSVLAPNPRSALAPNPPKGWNSWDCFGGSVTEAEVLANAEFMAERLLVHGWDTVVVDIQWYEPEPGAHDYAETSRAVLDAYGRPLPAENRFPSAAGGAGFGPLAERIHALGLKFGVHLMRGIPRRAVAEHLPVLGGEGLGEDGADVTAVDLADPDNRCPWNPDNDGVDAQHPAAQAWYDSEIELLASWGVDFVKLDDVLYPPVQRAEVELIHRAIERAALTHSDRPIVLSLSPGKELSLEQRDFLRANAQMWRLSDDLWDTWDDVLAQFQRAARWAPYQGRGGWGDLDMLPLGRLALRAHVGQERDSRLTIAEQKTMLALWNLARSPLMMGGHLPESPEGTIELLSNEAVLAVGECGGDAREIIRDGDLVVWRSTVRQSAPVDPGADPLDTAPPADDVTEVRGVFWLGDESAVRRLHAHDLGVRVGAEAADLWSGERVAVEGGWVEFELDPHGCALLAFREPEPA